MLPYSDDCSLGFHPVSLPWFDTAIYQLCRPYAPHQSVLQNIGLILKPAHSGWMLEIFFLLPGDNMICSLFTTLYIGLLTLLTYASN